MRLATFKPIRGVVNPCLVPILLSVARSQTIVHGNGFSVNTRGSHRQGEDRMESASLLANLGHLGSSGVVLSVEQRASLQSSLVLLRREHKFRRVMLWGVIRTVQGDYFIAVGVGADELRDRKALYR